MSISLRKVRPLHPGSIVVDILEDRGISQEEFCDGDYKMAEVLYDKRPMTLYFTLEVERKLGISHQLLLRMQKKLYDWDLQEIKRNEK